MGDFSSLRREQVEEGDVVESTGEDWLYMERAFLRQTMLSRAVACLPLPDYLLYSDSTCRTIPHLVHSGVKHESRDSSEQIPSL